MSAGLPLHRAWRVRARRTRLGVRPRRDDGFTLIEVITACALIGIVMASLTAFFVKTLSTASQQGQLQTAVQLAASRMEEIHAMDPSAIVTGADNQTVGGTTFHREWRSEICWQPANPANGVVGDCGPTPNPGGSWAELARIEVTVTWPDRTCRPGPCTHTTATMISRSPREPLFNNRVT